MNNYNFEEFKLLDSLFTPEDNYFLNQQLEYFEKHQPLKGVKILQNIPLTFETLKKVQVLLKSGADLTVTSPSFMKHNPKAKAILEKVGVKVQIEHQFDEEFDIILDCSAEMLGITIPRIGSVELTRSGTIKYMESENLSYPVIDIDSSRVKQIETVLGTGDGFIRAFKELVTSNLKDKEFIIFGYGKVGQGIIKKLLHNKAKVKVAEVNDSILKEAQNDGHKTIDGRNKGAIEKAVEHCYGVITATGRDHCISDLYKPEAFIGKVLANMGGGDEFGDKIPTEATIADKEPINFSIDKPTLMKYIDPIFYLHNQSAEFLTSFNLQPGVHTLPKFYDEKVASEWEVFHKETIE